MNPILLTLVPNNFYDPIFKAEDINSMLVQDGVTLLGIEDAHQQNMGHVFYRSVKDETEILSVYVAPKQRQQGVGRLMMEHTLRRLNNRGSVKVFLEVRASNKPAKILYERLGFQQVGVRKKYYNNPQEDALTFERTLNV